MDKSTKSNNFYLLVVSFVARTLLFFCVSVLILDFFYIINDLMGNTEIVEKVSNFITKLLG